jgi:hypothetical protein
MGNVMPWLTLHQPLRPETRDEQPLVGDHHDGEPELLQIERLSAVPAELALTLGSTEMTDA